jgi:transmembrane sensor
MVTLSFLLCMMAKVVWLDGALSTEPSEWVHQRLTDGSVMHVGPRSDLRLAFSDNRRSVELSHGEAVFEVADDPIRPFTVSTQLIDATAVGTRFGISIGPGVTVTVSEGTVKITSHRKVNEAQVVMLKAGEELRVSDRGLSEATPAKVDAERKLEWANGWLVFEGQTIGEAVNEFNRRNAVQIEIKQPEIAARTLPGLYRFRVDYPPLAFAQLIAEMNGLALIEDRSEEMMRLRLEERAGR